MRRLLARAASRRVGTLRWLARPVHRIEVPAFVLLTACSLVLGTAGFHRIDRVDNSLIDSCYASLQLFVLEFPATDDMPLELDIARFLAPLMTAYAAARTIVALFHERVALALVRRAGRHLVIAGLGEKGFQLARSSRDSGLTTVAIDMDPHSRAVGGCRERGIPLVQGDATDGPLLEQAGVATAAYLVAIAADDASNIDIAFSAGEVRRRRRGRLTAFVHLDDLSLWRVLQTRGIEGRLTSDVRLEFFNLFDLAARVLVETHLPLEADKLRGRSAPPSVAVIGDGRLADFVVAHVCRVWSNRIAGVGDRLALSILGPAACSQRERLLGRDPGLGEACILDAQQVDLFGTDHETAGADGAARRHDVVLVCFEDEVEGLAASLAMDAATDGRRRIVCAVREEGRGAGAALIARDGRRNVAFFGVLTRALTAHLIEHGMTEFVARANHEVYVAAQRARGVSLTENKSLLPWAELPDSLKDSNRRFADGIADKLAATGRALVPAPLSAGHQRPDEFSPNEIELLARMEHDRWCRDLLKDGWNWGAVKDPERRTHPLLVDWERLSEANREKDRDAVRAIPATLASAGFAIVHLSSGWDERPTVDPGGR